MLICNHCEISKPKSDFRKNQPRCKDCSKIYYKIRYHEKRNYILNINSSYRKTEQGKKAMRMGSAKYIHKFPEKQQARNIVAKAIKLGEINKESCEICGIKAEAHHNNYSEPLNIRWLCKKHHEEIHHKYVN